MAEKLDNWARLQQVIIWANQTTNGFAKLLGLSRAENLYQIKRGNNRISFDLADRIVRRYPQISKLWLLTGDGEMMADGGAQAVPFYDEDLAAVAVVGELAAASDIVLPRIASRCDFAMRCDAESSDAMTVVVLLRRCVGEPHAAGEYVALRADGTGFLLIVDDREDGRGAVDDGYGGFAVFPSDSTAGDDNIICEVMGRISMKNVC